MKDEPRAPKERKELHAANITYLDAQRKFMELSKKRAVSQEKFLKEAEDLKVLMGHVLDCTPTGYGPQVLASPASHCKDPPPRPLRLNHVFTGEYSGTQCRLRSSIFSFAYCLSSLSVFHLHYPLPT